MAAGREAVVLTRWKLAALIAVDGLWWRRLTQRWRRWIGIDPSELWICCGYYYYYSRPPTAYPLTDYSLQPEERLMWAIALREAVVVADSAGARFDVEVVDVHCYYC